MSCYEKLTADKNRFENMKIELRIKTSIGKYIGRNEDIED